MPPRNLRVFISAGEPSGDLHGGPVAAALRERHPGITIEALGGPHLAAAGAAIRFPMERYTVLGFAEVLRAIPAHWRMLRILERGFRAGRYDLALPIDYPGFNLRLAEAARRHGVPVLYYIAPKHWASGTRLTPRFGKVVNRVACIVPFEPGFFSRFGIAAEYVGHPLLDQPSPPPREDARRALAIPDRARVLALFPGSRRQEIARLWVPFRDAARRLRDGGRCDRVFVAAMPGMEYPGSEGFQLLPAQSGLVLSLADAAIVKSGTATLEAALAGVPMVVAYRVHPVTAWLARRLMRVSWVSLVNLIAGKGVVPELLQGDASPERLAKAVTPLLDRDNPVIGAQREGFDLVRGRLGRPGAAVRVAELAEELMGCDEPG